MQVIEKKMDLSGIAKVQHYVPRCILKNFADSKKRVWVFDKWTDRSYQSNIKNVAAEKGFYNFQVNGEPKTMENDLGSIEAKSSKIIRDIIRSRHLSGLDSDARKQLSIYSAVQLLRTRQQREHMKEHSVILSKIFNESGLDTETYSLKREQTEENQKQFQLAFLRKESLRLANYFLNKRWLLMETTGKCPFYISDHPIAMQNVLNQSKTRGTLGLNVKGIEIYAPLSSRLTLAYWCPSNEAALKQVSQHQKMMAFLSGDPVGSGHEYQSADRMIECLEKGDALEMSADTVENLNSLQVSASNRYIYSSINDFSLAKDMINENPDLRIGPRPEAR